MKNTTFKKVWSLIVALVLAVTPLLGAVPAFADEVDPIVVTDTITKYLQMPDGTTIPDGATFTFEFELQEVFNYEQAPEIGDMNVTFDATSPEIDAVTRARLGIAADTIVFSETTGHFLADIEWNRPGHFVFHVTERANTNAALMPFLTDAAYIEDMAYDTATFELHIIVSQVNGQLVVTGLYAWDLGSNWDGDLENQEGKVEYISFLNTFRRSTQPVNPVCPEDDPDYPYCEPPIEIVVPCPPTDPNYPCTPDIFDNALTISKRVSGDQSYSKDVFDFEIDVTFHSLATSTSVRAFVYTYDDGAWILEETLSFGAGTNDFELRHNQILVLDPLLIGTAIVVREINPAPYTATITLIAGGVGISGDAAMGPSTSTVSTGHFNLGEGTNYVGVLNVSNNVPITGLILNNLPVILVGISAIGFFAMVVVGKKRRTYE